MSSGLSFSAKLGVSIFDSYPSHKTVAFCSLTFMIVLELSMSLSYISEAANKFLLNSDQSLALSLMITFFLMALVMLESQRWLYSHRGLPMLRMDCSRH